MLLFRLWMSHPSVMAARGREKNSVILRLLQENVITIIITIIKGRLELTAKHD